MRTEPGAEPIDPITCGCCGKRTTIRDRDTDPWEGRLDGYCYSCALARCDAFPGDCVPSRLWRGEIEGGGPTEIDLSATALSADATPTASADVGPGTARATEGR